MTEEEKQVLIAETVEKLSQCVTHLKRAHKEGNDLVSTLRVLADCLDTNLSEVNVLYLPDPTHFTFSDSRDRAEQKYAFPPNQPRHLKDGKKRLLVHIPEGECLRELVGRIQALSGEVDNLAAQLRDEGIDIKDISRPLS